MNAMEYAKCRQAAVLYRNKCRQVVRLQEAMGIYTAQAREFDRQDEAVFSLVRANRARLREARRG